MYNRKRIARGAGLAVAAWALIGLLLMSTGVAYALPLAGIGGFTITADQVTADTLNLYPGVGDTSELDAYPQAVNELRNVKLQNLKLTKVIDVGTTPGLTGKFKVTLVANGQTQGDRLLLKASTLKSGDATFRELTITDVEDDTLENKFTVEAGDGVEFSASGDQKFSIRGHYLATDSISLSKVRLVTCYDPDDDDNYEVGPCDDTVSGPGNGGGGGPGGGKPTADFFPSPSDPNPGEQITFDGSLSTDDRSIASYQWNFGDGTTATGKTVTHAYSSSGRYGATLTVTDTDGNSDSTQIPITVDNERPVVSIFTNESDIRRGETVQINAYNSSDPDGSISSYEWDDDGDGTFEKNGPSITATYNSPGAYDVVLKLTDDNGMTSTQTKTIKVNRPPVASADADPDDVTFYPFEFEKTVDFSADGSYDPDGSIVEYKWEFEEGGKFENGDVKFGQNVEEEYDDKFFDDGRGEKDIRLTVTDNNGATDSEVVTVEFCDAEFFIFGGC